MIVNMQYGMWERGLVCKKTMKQLLLQRMRRAGIDTRNRVGRWKFYSVYKPSVRIGDYISDEFTAIKVTYPVQVPDGDA